MSRAKATTPHQREIQVRLEAIAKRGRETSETLRDLKAKTVQSSRRLLGIRAAKIAAEYAEMRAAYRGLNIRLDVHGKDLDSLGAELDAARALAAALAEKLAKVL